ALVEEADIGLQSYLASFAEPPEHGIFEMSRLVLGRNMLVTQLSPHGHDLGEFFDRSVPLHNSCRHDRDVLCDQPCIEAGVLGQHAPGAGELTKLVRALVTTARLKANRGDCERAQPCDQLRPTGCLVTHPKEPPLTPHPPPPPAHPPRPKGPSTRRSRKKTAWPSSYPILGDAGSCPGNCSGMEEATGAPSSFAV